MNEAMDASEYLMQIRSLDEKINSMLDKLEGLRSSALRITTVWKQDVVTGGGSQDRMATTVARIVDLQNEINPLIDAYIDKKAHVIRLLDKVHNPDYYTILYRRYLECETFESIAAEMHYTSRWICKLHGRALQVFSKIMDEEKKEILFNESERT